MNPLRRLYVTTPIYYVNDSPHIGHTYTTVLADVIVRYHQLLGFETHFLTGTDEHGQKVQQAAESQGVTPQEHVDLFNVRFKELWAKLNIQYDRFIRTTDEDHKALVQRYLQQLYDAGEIYLKSYGGWYSVSEERFFGDDELIIDAEGVRRDSIGNKPLEWVEEKNYFFKMSNYQQRLIDYINDHPDFILPDFRKNEVLGFLRQPLQDLCISRPKSRLAWGISLPFDDDYVTYVWFDALVNYVTGALSKKFSDGSSAWPADYHLIGKDILITHSVYWTTMLFALGIEQPRHILAHGWWLNDGAKMSKSSGTAINPIPYIEAYGVDPFRYFLMRDMVLGQDASFSDESFIKRLNSDLANDLGNGLNRVTNLISRHFDGVFPKAPAVAEETIDQELRLETEAMVQRTASLLQQLKLSQALEEIFSVVRLVNRYLEERAPWRLAKSPELRDDLVRTLRTSAEALRIALQLLYPVMPERAEKGLQMLGSSNVGLDGLRWGLLKGGEKLAPATPLFPRIEVEKKVQPAPTPKKQRAAATPESVRAALDLRVAQILSVEEHPNADSLYVLKIDDGSPDGRTLCAGLRRHYTKEELLQRKIILFANLKPAMLRGIESKGMLLAADGADEKPILLEAGENRVGERVLFEGVTPSEEETTLTLKDFSLVQLIVANGVASIDGMKLCGSAGPITAPDAPDGAAIH